jgi:hypothetical protein
MTKEGRFATIRKNSKRLRAMALSLLAKMKS